MIDIGTNKDGTYKYFDYDIDKNLIDFINIREYSNVDIVIMKELHRQLNYEKIQKVMHVLKWSWFMGNDPITIKEIQNSALRTIVSTFKLVKNVLKKDINFFKLAENIPLSTGTGGISVGCYGKNSYKIDFTISKWDTFIYQDNVDEDEVYYKTHCRDFYNARKSDERKRKIKNIINEETN